MPARETSSRDDPGEPLARGPFRSVFLAPGGEGEPDVVIKRFRHPHGLKRLRDGVRARREYRILAHLHAAGVRVPRPLALLDCRPVFDVQMEAVPQAVSLAQLFESARIEPGRTPTGGWERLLGQLGVELARLQQARVRQRDLGPKNVLVDTAGRPWLIDFHDARIRRRAITAAEARADLLAAAAAAREFLPARLRLRFLAAWRRASAIRTRIDLADLEARARIRRRATVAKGSGRWLRDSSRCSANGATLTRRGRTRDDALFAADWPLEAARRRWLSAARLLEHGLPVARPGELEQRGPTAHVTFDTPLTWSTEAGIRALLADRGLALPSWEDALLENDEHGVALRPPRGLLEV